MTIPNKEQYALELLSRLIPIVNKLIGFAELDDSYRNMICDLLDEAERICNAGPA